jgi:IS5 family transposase
VYQQGKTYKRYEFGNKEDLVTTSRDNWIGGIESIHGNWYYGHTLQASLEQAERLIGWTARETYVDLGYRGHGYDGETAVHVVNYRTMKRLTRVARRWFKNSGNYGFWPLISFADHD